MGFHAQTNRESISIPLLVAQNGSLFTDKDTPAEDKRYLDRNDILKLLKSCGNEKNLCKTKKIHMDLVNRRIVPKDVYVGTSLIRTYAKCGALVEAQQVFEELPIRSVVSWNALLSGLIESGLNIEALEWFKRMQDEGISPSVVTYICILKTCGSLGYLDVGQDIEYEIRKKGLLLKDVGLGATLVDMYAKCGALERAREVFESIPTRNVVTWTALICGYVKHGLGNDAISCFQLMQDSGTLPNAVTYTCVLKACSLVRNLEVGKYIHSEARKQGLLPSNVSLSNSLIDMYGKCGVLEKARKIFEQTPKHNVVSWTALISGYVHSGLGKEALKCFSEMQDEGVHIDTVTYVCALKACGMVRALKIGKQIAAEVRKQGLLQKDLLLDHALIDMYGRCGAFKEAEELFEQLPLRQALSWNVLMFGYAQHGFADTTLKFFKRMQAEGIKPDTTTYVCILKACGDLGCLEMGEKVYSEVRKQGLLVNDIVLGGALVDMYSKCGVLNKAREVFNELQIRDAVSWTTLIAGYAHHGHSEEALECFRKMQEEGIYPDVTTYVCISQLCGRIGYLEFGDKVYDEVRKQGLIERHALLGATLIDMYAKCGVVEKAREVFEQLPEKDVVSWTALIAGYTCNELGHEALKCFEEMQEEGILPNVVTYICILKVCGILGTLEIAEEVDARVREQGLLKQDIVLGNTLLDMYVKCGTLEKAREVFEERLVARDVVSWNAMMKGYAQLGQAHMVLELSRRMGLEGIMPDSVTFLVLLTACSHAGLIKEGEQLFDYMRIVYCFSPTIEHYTTMIDLVGRVGCFEKANVWLYEVPLSDCLPLYLAILGACQNLVNIELGRWIFDHVLSLNESCGVAYVSMRNIYVAAGVQAKADEKS